MLLRVIRFSDNLFGSRYQCIFSVIMNNQRVNTDNPKQPIKD